VSIVQSSFVPGVIGADVSKTRLDIHGLGELASVANDRHGIRRLVGRIRRSRPQLIVVEATGGYERSLVHGLLDAGLPVVRVNPLRVRRFAQSRGILAKTDRIDARVLADFGRLNADQLRPMQPISDNARMLQELIARRRQLVEQSVANKNQREHATLGSVRQSIDRTIKHLCKEIVLVEQEIQEIIDSDEKLCDRQRKLQSVPGIGPRVSRVLVSELLELGELDRRKIAALVATRHDPVIRDYYNHLKANGKPKKVALVACMRKRLNYLTAILSKRPPQAAERNEAGF
jgi:transposase